MMRQYVFGDRVRSIQIGKRGEFVGTVTYVGKGYFHIRDDEGAYWHRTYDELSPAMVEAAA